LSRISRVNTGFFGYRIPQFVLIGLLHFYLIIGRNVLAASFINNERRRKMPSVNEFSSTNNGCSTAALRGLDDQIVELLLEAVNNGSENLVRCDDIPRLHVMGNSTIPLLQPEARASLAHVIQQRNRDLNLIHAYRTVAQQFVLRQWKLNGRCGITAARVPGTSDHERGIAIDIDDFATWRETLEDNNWVWAGLGDKGHFSFHGGGISPKVITESVKAFQRLWNIHNPNDPIEEDGVYGDIETGPRLLLSPIGGFVV
jgi:D-alanyl-D-alanine carboxypeptidase